MDVSGVPAPSWSERTREPPLRGHIRPLFPPRIGFEHWWYRDRTLGDWAAEIEELLMTQPSPDVSGETILSASDVQLPSVAALHPPGYGTAVLELFHEIQRHRYLARKVLMRLQHRIWSRRIQCNVDMIDMEPIPIADRILLTDTQNRTIFAFHRRDIFRNLLSNISASAEMLPNPRPPTNPWTNQPLTRAQTMSICQKLLLDYARRGQCPPVLFAAFCAAKYDIRRFESENSALLAQHAIRAYFADLHEHNRDVVCDTVTQLLDEYNVRFSPVTVRRWFRQTPVTPLHREWLALARDYTLHLNLHIQPRPSWQDDGGISRDVRRLFARTNFSEAMSPRLRLLRGDASGAPVPVTMPNQAVMAFGMGAYDSADLLAPFTSPGVGPTASTSMSTLLPLLFTAAQSPTIVTALTTMDASGNILSTTTDISGDEQTLAQVLAAMRTSFWRM